MLPPIHLRDVRENLAALAREAGDLLHSVAADLRETRWDAQSAADWSRQAAWLERRLDALYSARSWSRESLRLTSGPLRRLHRGPTVVPPEDEDQRWSRVTGSLTALTRSLAVAADEHRTPVPPEGPVLDLYARLLRLIGDACHTEARELVGERADTDPAEATGASMEELHRRLQEGLREQAGHGAGRTAVLGALLLQAENLWAEIVPEPHTSHETREPHESNETRESNESRESNEPVEQ